MNNIESILKELNGFPNFFRYGGSNQSHNFYYKMMINTAVSLSKMHVYIDYDVYQKTREILGIFEREYEKKANESLEYIRLRERFNKNTSPSTTTQGPRIQDIKNVEEDISRIIAIYGVTGGTFTSKNPLNKFLSEKYVGLYLSKKNKLIPTTMAAWTIVEEWKSNGTLDKMETLIHEMMLSSPENAYKITPFIPALLHFGCIGSNHLEIVKKALNSLSKSEQEKYHLYQSIPDIDYKPKSRMTFVKETINAADFWTLVFTRWTPDNQRLKSLIQMVMIDYRLSRDHRNAFTSHATGSRVCTVDRPQLVLINRLLKSKAKELPWVEELMQNTHRDCDVALDTLKISNIYDIFEYLNPKQQCEEEIALVL